jgi:hypothetical protein
MPDTTLREDTLAEATRLTMSDRNKDYDEPIDNFTRITDMLNALGYSGPGGRKLQAHDNAIIQTVVKLSRLVTSPTKADTWIDLAGYAACGREVAEVSTEDDIQLTEYEPTSLAKNTEGYWVYAPYGTSGEGRLKFFAEVGALRLTYEQATNLALSEANKHSLFIVDLMHVLTRNYAGQNVYTWKTWMDSTESGPDVA